MPENKRFQSVSKFFFITTPRERERGRDKKKLGLVELD